MELQMYCAHARHRHELPCDEQEQEPEVHVLESKIMRHALSGSRLGCRPAPEGECRKVPHVHTLHAQSFQVPSSFMVDRVALCASGKSPCTICSCTVAFSILSSIVVEREFALIALRQVISHSEDIKLAGVRGGTATQGLCRSRHLST